MKWLNFIEKLYFTIVDLFWRYKSDNHTNIAYINYLKIPLKLGKRYYYTLHFESATLYVPIIWSGVASPQSQNRYYMADQRVDWREGMISFLPTFEIDVASDYIELLIACNSNLEASQEQYYTPTLLSTEAILQRILLGYISNLFHGAYLTQAIQC